MSYQAASNQPVLQQSIRKALRRTTTAIAILGLPGIALAGPEDGEVVRGDADITYGGTTTTIDQHTNNAVINWQTFNVDADEFVIFNQLDSSSVVLNRVLSSNASYILGQIEANGQVFLLNPNGIFFGDGAVLDVQGFLGSTLDIDNDDFMAGDYSFQRADNAAALGQVVNDGSITAGEGGYVVLAGDFTENNGLISAQGGTAALVSGNALTLDLEGDGLVSFAVDEETLAGEAGVHNAGQIIADGGMVVMTARVAHEVTSTVVNNEGLVRARSIEEQGGDIYLVGNGGNVENSGTLDANGENADGGVIGLHATHDIVLADGGVQTADGDTSHDGGTVRAIAADHLDFQADNLISATGGNDGGFVEVSGHGSIALRGMVEVGRGGTYLIDPASINIVSGSATGSVGTVGVNLITDQLDQGANVVVAASNQITATATALNATGTGDLTLGIGAMSAGTGGSCIGLGSSLCFGPNPTFTPGTGGTINVSGMAINIAGNIDLIAQAGSITAGSVTANNISAFADNVTLGNVVATGNMNIGSSASRASVVTVNGLASAGGDISVWASGVSAGIEFTDAVTATGNISLHANTTNSSFGNIIVGDDAFNFTGAAISAGGTVTLDATGGLNGGNIYTGAIIAGGSITITGSAGNGAGGQIRIGDQQNSPSTVFTPANVTASTGNITITSDRSGISVGNVTATTGSISLDAQFVVLTAGSISAGGNVTTTAGEHNMSAATITAGGTATITGSGGISHSIAGITAANVNGTFTPSGSGSLSVNINNVIANGTGTDGNVGLSMTDIGGLSTGLLTIGNISANGNVTLSAFDGAISAGGNINVTDGINASGLVDITALGNGVAEGNVTIATATLGGVAISGNGINITASGRNNQSVGGSGGSIDITGQVLGGLGTVTLSATGVGGIGAAGNVQVSGNSSAGQISGQSISISANGVNGGGRIDLGSGAPESSFQAAALTATGGNVSLTAVAGEGVINAGTISATGDVTIDNQVGQGHVHIGDYVAGSLTAANITAGNNFLATINGSVTAFDVGAISAGNNLTINLTNGFSHSFGTLNAGGLIDVNLSTVSNFTLGSANGGSIDLNLPSVGLTLGELTATAGNITISGQNVSISDSLVVAAGAISLTSNSSFSTFNDFSGSAVTLNFTGPGSGKSITVGNITANTGSIQVLSSNSGGSANLTLGNLNAATSILASNAGAFSGNLTVTSTTTTGGTVTLRSIATSGNAAISLSSNASAGGNLILDANATGGFGTVSVDGNLNAGGNLSFTSNVDTISFGTGSHTISAGSDILMNNNSGLTLTGSAGSVDYNAGFGVFMQLADVLEARNINAGGTVSINAVRSGVHSAGNITAGHIDLQFQGSDTSNNVTVNLGSLHATGTASGARDVAVSINPVTGFSNGGLTVASATADNGGVSLSVFEGNSSANGTLTVSGPIDAARVARVAATGNVSIGNITGGQVDVGSLRFGSVTAGSITATGGSGLVSSGNVDVANGSSGNVVINGGVSATGAVTVSANGISTSLGQVDINGNVTGSSVSITAQGGLIDIGTGSREVNYTAGDVTATTGNVTLTLTGSTGGGGVIVAGNINAANNVSITANTGQGHVHLGDYTAGALTPANITAGGSINISADGSQGAVDAGSLSAGNLISVVTDNIKLTDVFTTLGNITLTASGNNSSNGNLNVINNIETQSGSVNLSAVHNTTSVGGGGNLNVGGTVSGQGGNVTISAANNIGSVAGGNISLGGVTATGLTSINANDASGSGGNVTVTTSGVHGDSGVNIGASNANVNATVDITGTILTPNNVTINASGGIIGSSLVVDTSAGGAGLVSINADINVSGNVDVWAINNGNIDINGAVSAGGAVSMHANGSTAQGNILIDGPVSGSDILLNAFGPGGNIEIGTSTSGIFTGAAVTATAGSINLSATGSGVDAGHIFAGALNATPGDVILNADGQTGSNAGVIRIGAYDSLGLPVTPQGITAGGNVSISLAAASASGGTLQASGISAGGNLTFNVSGPGTFDTTAIATTIGGGFSFFGSGGSAYNFGSITATNIVIDVTPAASATTTITTGNLSATGTLSSLVGNVEVGINAGATSGGTINVGTVNAINDLDLTVGSSPAAAQTGNISAASLTAGGSLIVFAPDNVTTGALSGGPQIFLSGGNSVTVNGGISGSNLLNIEASGSGAGLVDINGNITAGTISITAAGSQGRIDLGTGASPEFSFNGADLNATAGGVSLNANGSNSGGGVINVGSVTATGGVGISASGGAGGAHIHIGDYTSGVLTAGSITAGASIGLFANSNGAGTLNSGALVDVGNVSNTAGAIIITANANGGSGSGALNGGNVNAGNVLATGALNINATGANGGGNIGFNSAQGAGVVMTASGDSLGGDLSGTTVTGTGTSNDVSLNAIGSAGGGGITLNGAVSQRDLALWATGGNLSIGTGNLSAGGNVGINANGGSSHNISDVNAAGINMQFTPSSGGTVNVNTGLLTAGTGGTSDHIFVNVNPSDPTATGNLTIAGATANNGHIILDIGNGSQGMGSLTVNGALTADGFVRAVAPNGVTLGSVSARNIDIYTANGAVVTGALTASNSTGGAFIKINTEALTGGDISIAGPVTINGTATSTNPLAAGLSLVTGFGGSNTITVGGNISVTGAATNYTFSDQGVSETGFVGETNIRIDAGSNGAVSLANIAMDGVGRGALSVNGDQIGVGSLTLNLGNGSFTQSFTTSCGGTCNLTNTQTLTSGGFLDVSFGNSSGTGTSLTLGDINITAPGANVDIGRFQTITGGLVNITASGFDYMAGSTGTLEGSTVSFSQTVTNGGDAALYVAGASTAAISFGNITLDGAGSASLELFGDVITVGSVALTASGGTFTVTGSPAFGSNHSFDEGTPGPRIDEGTITGGLTRIEISGTGGTGSIAASQVDVLGSISATAAGAAEVFVNANNISVSGNITASATANVIKNGTVDDTFFDSDAGASFHTSGTIFSSLGGAHVDLLGSSAGTVSAGNISMSGAQAGGTVTGGTLNLGNVTVTATGGSIDATETTTNLDTGTSESVVFQGPALINGVRLAATGALNMGSLNVSGVGAGGALLEGSSVSMGSVSISFTDAGYQVLDPDVFGSSTHSFTLGDALFDLNAATASINGNVVVSGTQMAHVGGNINATGTITVSGANGVNQPIREEVNYLNNIDDGSGSSIVVTTPLSLSGSAVSLSASTGSLELSNTAITTVNDLTLTAGAGIDLSAPTLSIGGSIIVNGPSLNLGGGSTANYDLVTNVGEINLGTVGTVIIDNTASTGTTTLNQSGTAASLTITDGGTLALGTAISADTISLSANTVSLGTNSISAANLLALSGAGVDLGGNNLAGSVIDIAATSSITGVGGISADTLTLDAPAIMGESINLAAGSLTLGTGSVTATTSINLDLGSTAAIGGATFVAPTLGISATAPSLTVQANAETLNIGSVESLTVDNFANTGTTTLNQSGTAANLSIFAGGTLTLGTALEAGGIALSGSALDLGSHDVTASGSLDLLTSTSLTATGTLAGASILVEAWSAPGLQLTTNTGDLTIFGNGSVSVDNTAHTGTANVSLGGEVLDAVAFAFGGDAAFLSGFNAGSFTALGAGLDLSNQTITTTGDMTFALGGDLVVGGASLDAGGVLDVDAANVINGGAPASITADAVLMTATGNISLGETTLTIGSGSLEGIAGDGELMSLLGEEGVTTNVTGPNAVFWASSITLGNLNFSGDYLQLNTDQLTITGAVTATDPDTVVQLAPLDVAASIGVEDGTGGTGTVNYSNISHLSHFQGLTVAIGGTGHDGAIDIGTTGTIDIGDTNFFAVTQGTVSGLDNVLSTGIVKDLDGLLGIGFETPQTEEIDSSQDTSSELEENFGNDPADSIDEDDLSDDEEEGDEEGEDTEDDVIEEEEDDSLISQDTAEEELMCE